MPTGTEGTVYMSLAQANFEYKGDKKKTKDNRRDGFFTVGDWGLLDEDGYLFLKDRKSDMIISGGVNIYPAEIEAVLLTMPEDRRRRRVRHPPRGLGRGDQGRRRAGAGRRARRRAPRRDLRASCKRHLAKFKRPKTIDFVAELPRDPNGKLYKRKLRDPYWEGKQRQI